MNKVRPEQGPSGMLAAKVPPPPAQDGGVTTSAAVEGRSEGQDPGLPWAFLCNLMAISALGLGISAWLLHYTDKFETAASLFALTGVFSWIAAVTKLLPPDRVKALQSASDRFVLNSWIFLALVVIFGAGFFWWADGRGTIEVQSRCDLTDRSVTITETGSSGEQLTLDPGGRVRFSAATSRSSPRELLVKVSGYPDRHQRLLPWQLVTLKVPSSFLRPVLLAKPDVDLIDQRDQELRIVVKLNNHLVSEGAAFTGHAFWLGGDEDIEIPSALQDGWREELTKIQRSLSVRFWQTPVVLPGERIELKPQDQLCVEFQRPNDKSVYLRQDIVIKQLHDFPQVEDIHVPDPKNPDPPHC